MAIQIAKMTGFGLACLVCAGQVACVKSNLDNAFDPASIPGMIIGLAISSGSGSSGGSTSSISPSASVCSDVTPTIVRYNTPGTSTYSVPATAKYVTIEVIGGGGAIGNVTVGAGPCTTTSTAGNASSAKIQGAVSDLISATGGQPGSCGTDTVTGIGGAGGSPNGQTGSNGWLSPVPGGDLGTFYGRGGGYYGTGTYAGGGGGSGGRDTNTFSNLAGQTLEITIGAGAGIGIYSDGSPGQVILIVF